MSPVPPHAQPAPAAEYLALGDSYTIGEGVDTAARWPVQLAVKLRARGITLKPPHLVARTGWTTEELSAALDAEQASGQLQKHYRLVSLLIGVNNEYRGASVKEYGLQFSGLLDRAIGFAGGNPAHVLVVSIPDWGVTPFARASGRDRRQIAREIDQFNLAAAELCKHRHVPWVNITDLSRNRGYSHWLVEDGLHPSAPMYRLWVDRILATVAM